MRSLVGSLVCHTSDYFYEDHVKIKMTKTF